jgi:hypothetical protein|tara:strand:- start:778 stop:1074 length:297 start_codon:yes stop_codon:yes gene_type:complete
VVECKSCKADYQAVPKWQGYLEWCDRFFWAVDSDFPIKLLPDSTGVILADAYDTEITRMAPLEKLAAARRKKGGGAKICNPSGAASTKFARPRCGAFF